MSGWAAFWWAGAAVAVVVVVGGVIIATQTAGRGLGPGAAPDVPRPRAPDTPPRG